MARFVRPLALITLLALCATVCTKRSTDGRLGQEPFDLSRTVQRAVRRPYFRQRQYEKSVLEHHMTESWLEILKEASEWLSSHCACQFGRNMWNCTTSSWKKFLLRAHPEAGYFRAALSASVVFHTARHCAMGKITCYMGNTTNSKNPSHLEYKLFFSDFAKKQTFCDYHFTEGLRAAKILDILDGFFFHAMSKSKKRRWSRSRDLHTNYYNNAVGREKIKDIRPHLRCFCSGPSGTCVLKTCSYVETKRMLTRTADALYQQYQKFVNGGTAAVESARALIAEAQVQPRPATVATHRNMSVIATRHSPNYCRRNSNWGLLGPRGRSCREACGENVEYFTGSPACNEICCGRLHTHVTEYQCDCKLEDWDLRCKICSRAVTVCA
ncbi:protein Wnt-4-like [Sycon ciliatum]|uniref:protein Wnt-4-like n=1 Tax=Sycon ciliatum TaxID=27933 RepID=UPI0031F6C70D